MCRASWRCYTSPFQQGRALLGPCSCLENPAGFPNSYRAVPVWRNWQKRGTLNLRVVGSTPTRVTSFSFP
jgi:hypothetical protein